MKDPSTSEWECLFLCVDDFLAKKWSPLSLFCPSSLESNWSCCQNIWGRTSGQEDIKHVSNFSSSPSSLSSKGESLLTNVEVVNNVCVLITTVSISRSVEEGDLCSHRSVSKLESWTWDVSFSEWSSFRTGCSVRNSSRLLQRIDVQHSCCDLYSEWLSL